jgi:hypothetical protein
MHVLHCNAALLGCVYKSTSLRNLNSMLAMRAAESPHSSQHRSYAPNWYTGQPARTRSLYLFERNAAHCCPHPHPAAKVCSSSRYEAASQGRWRGKSKKVSG